jgi:hypothetical protein
VPELNTLSQLSCRSDAAVTISLICVLGFVATPFLPETRRKPLPNGI